MKKVKILLVDDSQLVLRHVAMLLSGKGWQVTTAATMAEGLEECLKSPPDALLTDFILDTGQTGLTLISAIFAAGLAEKPTAAVMTLGALSDDDQALAARLGCPVLQKPAQGKEKEFLQNVEFWLHDAGLI